MSADTSEHELTRFSRSDLAAAANYFRDWGYAIIAEAFPVAQGDAFWNDLEAELGRNTPLTFSVYGQLYTYPEVPLEGRRTPRIIDVESHVASAPDLMLAPAIVEFLTHYYSAPPTCLQTLTYKYSSEQGAHSDKTLVSPPWAHDYDRETLTASWLAMENSDERNGALIVYPGSHKLKKRGLGDFNGDYGPYTAYVDTLCRESGCAPKIYRARAGEILFWHSDLVHAGGPITAPGDELPTRRSLVCHYAHLPSRYQSRDPNWRKIERNGASYFAKAR